LDVIEVGKLKAFCLAFAFLLVTLPASAEELPQTSNAWRATQAGLAEPEKYKWTVVDEATGEADAVAAAHNRDADQRSAPARAALAQIKAETQRVMGEAQRTGTKVSRIRYDLRVRCLVEQVELDPETVSMSQEGALPYIWGVKSEDDVPATGTMEVCEVDYSQRIRAQADGEGQTQIQAQPRPQMDQYKVAFPVD